MDYYVVLNVKKVAKFTARQRFVDGNSLFESFPNFHPIVLVKRAEMRTNIVIYVFRFPFYKVMYSIPLCGGFLSVKHVTIFKFYNVTNLNISVPPENHEIRFASSNIQCFRILYLTFMSKKYTLRKIINSEKLIQIGNVRNQIGNHSFQLIAGGNDARMHFTDKGT